MVFRKMGRIGNRTLRHIRKAIASRAAIPPSFEPSRLQSNPPLHSAAVIANSNVQASARHRSMWPRFERQRRMQTAKECGQTLPIFASSQ